MTASKKYGLVQVPVYGISGPASQPDTSAYGVSYTWTSGSNTRQVENGSALALTNDPLKSGMITNLDGITILFIIKY